MYLNYAVEDGDRQADLDVFLSHFGLDKSRLVEVNDDDGKSVLEQLQDCLSFSPQARRYLLLSLLYTASTPVDPFLNTAVLAAAPLAAYSLYKRMFRVPNNIALNSFVWFGGYLVACLSFYGMKFLQQRYSSWATFSYECEDSETAREELRDGATEYLQKLSQIQEIVNKYSTMAKKPSLWNDYQVYTAKRRLADLDVFAKKDCPVTSVTSVLM